MAASKKEEPVNPEEEVYAQYKYNRKPRKLIEQIINIVNETDSNARILSLGSGDGYVERFIEEQTSRRIQCLDVSPKGVEIAQKRGLNAIEGSVYDLPFEDDSFDLVLAIHIFEHLVNPEIFLAEVHRVLNHQGAFFISLPNYGNLFYRLKYLLKGSLDTFLQIRLGHFRHYSYREACRYLEEHNFRITRKMTFIFGHQYFGFLTKIHKNLLAFSTLLLAEPV